jgi:L-alanine-DL-glutamate epimerase-like enolase superfamily enzyme
MPWRTSWNAMVARTRNLGRPGIVSMAISAVDIALWDLKARPLELPLLTLLGGVRDSVSVYGSGGSPDLSRPGLGMELKRGDAQRFAA